MGWGVNDYPTKHGFEPIDDRAECEGFRCTNLIEPGEEGECSEKDCHRTVLCDGCTFTCESCHRTFCRDHILIHEQADRFATYRCYACDRQRQAKEAA